ncbi:MAG TPA: class I SAM-dependent methyltransferase [Acidimicrobiales bacterium]|nr:class I SAM-dependent methyltransferase [Acidimicrobiales bacterium]
MALRSRYDGYADWYDEQFPTLPEEKSLLRELLDLGNETLCLNVACGTGRYGGTLSRLGYRVLGVDVSADALRRARRGVSLLVRADAASLPLRSESVGSAVGFYFHTDVEDFAGVMVEVARCMKPEARFVYFGLHPCFIGPFVDRTEEAQTQDLHFKPGYGQGGWAWPDFNQGSGLWVRVGGHHKTMAEFLNAIFDAGLSLERVVELDGGGSIAPRNIAVVASKAHF